MPPGKLIGRILSLGFPLPGPLVDNYNFLTAPSFFDYDALVVDPAELSHLIAGVVSGSLEATTFHNERVRNDASADAAVRLAAVLMRRRDEAAKLLDNGGLIVCVLQPETAHRAIAGVDSLGDYYWMPPTPGFDTARVRPADGAQVEIVDYGHPLAAFLQRQLANVAYRAFLDVDSLPGFAASGGRVFARSRGGAPVGVELPVEAPGRIVLTPALNTHPAGDARYVMSDDLQAGIRRALGAEAAGREPPWLSSFTLAGLDDRRAALVQAQAARDDAQAALDDAQRAYEDIARYRRLLWQEGAVGLNETVVAALRLIGIDAYAQDQNALELRIDGRPVLLEIEASEQAIDLAPHYRLRQRIESAIERRGEATRGLLIVNGCRLAPPSERTSEISDALRIAAETMRYCVAPASTLFAAVAAHLAGDAETVAAYRCRLATHEGVIE